MFESAVFQQLDVVASLIRIITPILSLLLTGVLVYVYITQNDILDRQKEIQESQRKIQKVQQLPNLHITRLKPSGPNFLKIVITNSGDGAASSIRVKNELVFENVDNPPVTETYTETVSRISTLQTGIGTPEHESKDDDDEAPEWQMADDNSMAANEHGAVFKTPLSVRLSDGEKVEDKHLINALKTLASELDIIDKPDDIEEVKTVLFTSVLVFEDDFGDEHSETILSVAVPIKEYNSLEELIDPNLRQYHRQNNPESYSIRALQLLNKD